MKNQYFFMLSTIVLFLFGCNKTGKVDDRIQPWADNPWFWQYKGKPVMLLGASNDDNLFQWPNEKLIPHLDSMQSIGVNYVRNTMSDRKDKGFELYPFKMLEPGKYDLEHWNDEYWERFDNFLKETAKRDIIVQIEVWDRFDYSQDNWPPHPYNPGNNINYTFEESALDSIYPDHPIANKQPFFFTTPGQRNNKFLLNVQKSFVDNILSYSLNHNHVLYCIDNETSAEEEWATFWSRFIRNRADEIGKNVCITEMWGNTDLKSEVHKRTFDYPERYDYCDVSQNNHRNGQEHWDNFQWVRNYLNEQVRPINTIKTYGADGWSYGDTNEGVERWWRHIIGGAASVRFHRPAAGLGLSAPSVESVKAARKIESIVKFWELIPGNKLLSDREENEAYLSSKSGEAYLIFFTDGGEVGLDLSDFNAKFNLRWMEIKKGEWQEESQVLGGEIVQLVAPGKMNGWQY